MSTKLQTKKTLKRSKHVRIEELAHRRLKLLAVQRGTTVASLATRIIYAHLENKELRALDIDTV